jgi:hypothetical protein
MAPGKWVHKDYVKAIENIPLFKSCEAGIFMAVCGRMLVKYVNYKVREEKRRKSERTLVKS